jgi:hypothetical protein
MSHKSLFLANVLPQSRPGGDFHAAASVSAVISARYLRFQRLPRIPAKRDSEIHLNPEAGNDHRSAIAVETRIVYEGEQGREIEATLHVGRIVGLTYALTSVLQATVAEHEAQAAQAQILAMVLAQTAVDEGRPTGPQTAARWAKKRR